jgi:hypothetical protein
MDVNLPKRGTTGMDEVPGMMGGHFDTVHFDKPRRMKKKNPIGFGLPEPEEEAAPRRGRQLTARSLQQ